MGALADELADQIVRVHSPDGLVTATVSGRQLDISFAAGAYSSYDERSLSHQLAKLGTLTLTAYRRSQRVVMARAFDDDLVTDDGIEYGLERRHYRQRLANIVVAGTSPDDSVQIRINSLASWEVTIADGTLRRLPQYSFVAALGQAVAEVLARHRREVAIAIDEVYGFGPVGNLWPARQ